ncbi:hypothetical protein EDD15DRAFT_2169539, partial [Pisolithus albus]
ASCQITAEQHTVKCEALQADINLFLEEQKCKLEAIMTTHNVMVKYLDHLVTLQTYYHMTCKPHLMNVLIHAKAKEVNLSKFHEVCNFLANDPKMQPENLSKEQNKYYIQELLKQHDLMAHGVHANNIAAGEDVFSVTHQIIDELENLHDHTGIYASLFITHGHINDSTQASWYGTDNSMMFWEDVLGCSVGDVACLYEQWACAQGHSESTLCCLQIHALTFCCSVDLEESYVTGKQHITMNYSNYNTSIAKTYGVKLLGWPTGIPFVNPSSIGTISEIHKLCDSLKSGAQGA